MSRRPHPRGTARAIHVFDTPILRSPARPVAEFDRSLATLVADLTATMQAAAGVGLAANQIGVDLQVLVFACADATGAVRSGHVINPELVVVSARRSAESSPEGCLSVPGPATRVARPSHVQVTGVDRHGDPVTVDGTGMLAVCLSHEVDHLSGRLYLDHLSRRRRRAVLDAYQPPPAPYAPSRHRSFERIVIR